MFKFVKRCMYYWVLSRQVKKNLKKQLKQSKNSGFYKPPTRDEVLEFKKEYDMRWDSPMIQRVESSRTTS